VKYAACLGHLLRDLFLSALYCSPATRFELDRIGQSFRPEMMEKVRRVRELRDSLGVDYEIEVDGGINPATARVSIESGANVLVAGTSIFNAPDYATAIRDLRGG